MHQRDVLLVEGMVVKAFLQCSEGTRAAGNDDWATRLDIQAMDE
eukprot:CAMPEP_0181491918 /NCGR_PEP_ID=MMETSP1110-20121109/50400_1 /TAXON_ID=174948 /ORGANISM="Symbiodinium sp., Strain CCMP421" /LENGTH=43 /DNA_ID= /DNA_START= /DNA_END= /DNA_ORIENTATION=